MSGNDVQDQKPFVSDPVLIDHLSHGKDRNYPYFLYRD